MSDTAESSYRAAGNGRRLRTFRPSSLGPNAALMGLPTLLARARHLARNDPWMVSALNKSVSNGIATGIQAKPIWGTKEHKKKLTKLWERWGKYADADGVLGWGGLQALAWREWKEAGEVFARIRYRRPGDGLPVPLQVQLIESEQCPQYYNGVASNGNVIRQGIEVDSIGRRVAYWMYREHPGDMQLTVIGNELVRVPAEQVLHLYRPNRAGAMRGVPSSAPALLRMFNLDRLDDAVLERQALANLFAGFITTDANADGEDGDAVGDLITGEDADGTAIGVLSRARCRSCHPAARSRSPSRPALVRTMPSSCVGTCWRSAPARTCPTRCSPATYATSPTAHCA